MQSQQPPKACSKDKKTGTSLELMKCEGWARSNNTIVPERIPRAVLQREIADFIPQLTFVYIYIYFFFLSLLFCVHGLASLGLKQLGSCCCPGHCLSCRLASNPACFARACARQCWQKTLRPVRQSLWDLWPVHGPSGCHSSCQHLEVARATSFSLEECLRCRPLHL